MIKKEKMTLEMWGSKLIQDQGCRLRYQIVYMPQAAMPASDILGPAVHLCLPWPAAGYCCWNLLQCLCTQPSHKGTYNNDSSTNRSSVLQLLHTGQINKKILMMWLSSCLVLQPIASVAGCSSRGWQKGLKLLQSNTRGYTLLQYQECAVFFFFFFINTAS